MDKSSVPSRLVLVQVERPAGHIVHRRVDPAWVVPQVRYLCAWGGKFLRGPRGAAATMVSHGLCESCKARLLKEHDDDTA